MDDLTARLQALMRRYAASCDQPGPYQRFRKELNLLISEYGYQAVDAALDNLPEEPWPSVSLH
jgi:hypothetical protein